MRARRWKRGAVLGCGGLVLVALVVLWWQVPAFYGPKLDGRAGAIATTRTGILTVAAGLIAFLGVTMNLAETRRANEQARERDRLAHERELATQLADRYTVSVGQLGSDNLDVRLGGIYALERLASDSEQDHRTIVEVLSAFVRENTIAGRPGALRRGQSRHATGGAVSAGTDTDVQAALTILGRLPERQGVPRADLPRAELQNAYLPGAHLEKARMFQVYLQGANLREARLRGANLWGASLQKANLAKAHLEGVNLCRADLSDARGLTDEQIAAARGDASTVLPDGIIRPASWPKVNRPPEAKTTS